MGLVRWIVEKVVVYGLVLGIFYIIGQSLGIVPQPMKCFGNMLHGYPTFKQERSK
jgi:hypothetical protein